MKTIALPLILFLVGLFVAEAFFGLNIESLFEGFFKFLKGILTGFGP